MNEIFVVGGGFSLRGFDFTRLNGVKTMTMNESFFSVENSEYFITLDSGWVGGTLPRRRDDFRKFEESKTKKYYVNPWSNKTFRGINKMVRATRTNPFSTVPVIDGEYGEFAHGYNSGYCAVQLALKLGFDKIYLMGIDLKAGPDNKSHYHDKYTYRRNYNKILKPYLKMFMDSLNWLSDFHRDRIVSCSPVSSLNAVIEFKDIDELLPNTLQAESKSQRND